MDGKRISVLLDLDDTLLDFGKAEEIALTRALKDMGVEANPEILRRYSEINAQQWHRFERGEASRDEILLRRFEIFFEELGLDCSGAEARDLYEDYLCYGHFFIDGAEELLKTLYPDYGIYLVSNGTAKVQAGRMKSADIVKYFSGIFVSEEIGSNKPEKEFFERCFKKIQGFKPENCVIVGDSLTSDIKGGINAGIKTVWFNPDKRPGRSDITPDYELNSLRQLPSLLKLIFA